MLRTVDESCAAIFKPIDEEPFAPNNPREMRSAFGSETCRSGIKSGESTIREVAAYVLDCQRGANFSSVPRTGLIEMSHENFFNDTIYESNVVSPEFYD